MSPARASTMSATWPASTFASSCRYVFSMSMTSTATSLTGSCIPRYVFGQQLGMDFYSAYHQGFVRVAACTHHTAIADPAANAESVLRVARDCHDDSVALAVFPELTLSGYSIEDILLQDALLDAVEDALLDVVVASAELMPVLVIGAPLRYQHRIYNNDVVIHRGSILGVVPKSYLPTYREFYERRQMAVGDTVHGAIRVGDADVPLG